MSAPLIESVLVANRGEIARRVIRTAKALGIRTIAVYSEADAELPYVTEADEAHLIGPAAAGQSYLDAEKILEVARTAAAVSIHPGYGFLAESSGFARAVREAGLVWIGPTPESMDAVADKINARNLMASAGVPVAAGSPDPIGDAEQALVTAQEIGYPVIVKPSGGGGGIGMTIAWSEDELAAAFDTAKSRAERFFGDPRILIEQYIPRARHVEVQILGLADGRVIALGERDCSVQRRHQKVLEETPSPGITPELRTRMLKGAIRAGETVGYRNAGTVECLVDPQKQTYVFLEMNTRLQVEHPITETVFDVDLVEAQLRIASGQDVQFDPETLEARGVAIEMRLYAEDPLRFLPSPGVLDEWIEPTGEGTRVDAGYTQGNRVTPHYDPLLAKIIVSGATRNEALDRAGRVVQDFTVSGLKTNLPFFDELLHNEQFRSGDYDTGIVEKMRAPAAATH